MTSISAEPLIQKPGAARGAIHRVWIVLALFALGAIAVQFAPTFFDSRLEKNEAPLSKPLFTLPRRLDVPDQMGVQFETPTDFDDKLPDDQVEALGTPDYLLRRYARKGTTSDAAVELNLNYYGKGEATPHVPDFCWVGSGMTRAMEDEIVIPHVRRKDGSYIDLHMRMLSFYPKTHTSSLTGVGQDDRSGNLFQNVAYTFHVNGDYVPNRTQVVKTFWRPENEYAYHCKIEVNVLGLTTRAEAEKIVGDFVRASLADIEECLPDPKILHASKTTPAVTGSTK